MSTADHFGHRESNGIVVDLFWNHGRLEDEFRVEVADEREGNSHRSSPCDGERGDPGLPPPVRGLRVRRTERGSSRRVLACAHWGVQAGVWRWPEGRPPMLTYHVLLLVRERDMAASDELEPIEAAAW